MSSTKRAREEDSVVLNGKRELGAPEPKRRRGPAMTIKRRRERKKRAWFHRARTTAVTAHGKPMEVDPPPVEPMEVDPPPEEPMEVDSPAAQPAWHHTTVPGPASARSQLRHRWSGRWAPYPPRGPTPSISWVALFNICSSSTLLLLRGSAGLQFHLPLLGVRSPFWVLLLMLVLA